MADYVVHQIRSDRLAVDLDKHIAGGCIGFQTDDCPQILGHILDNFAIQRHKAAVLGHKAKHRNVTVKKGNFRAVDFLRQ